MPQSEEGPRKGGLKCHAPTTHPESTEIKFLACWNVRTLTPGFNTDTDLRKTSLLYQELDRLNVDIAALSETRLPDSGSIKESIYTIFWYGRSQGQKREQGVGFAIRNSIIPFCETAVGITTRLMSLRVHTSKGPLMIFSVYAPTLQADDEVKNIFYQLLEQEIEKVPRTETVIILGDFNARVGRAFESWNGILGKHGVRNMNDNGQLVLDLLQVKIYVSLTLSSKGKYQGRHPGDIRDLDTGIS